MRTAGATLAERLGYEPDAKLLIVNCDDLGSTRSANVAVYEALRDGLGTSATLMVPCPWARDAAAMYRGEDVGVHLTLNAEWDTYRWGPITHSPSLLDGDGGFPRTVEDVWDHADVDEVRKECRAQIERAIVWGFDVSHLDAHMGTLQLRAEFFDVYLEMAVEFRLPLRMAGASGERLIGFPYRQLAAAEGVVFTDHFVRTGVGSRRTIEKRLFDMRPGVTEVYLHPAIDTDELRASHPDWANRVEDHALLTRDPAFADLVERTGARLIGYRDLRELQRSA
jgi:chitin disaccharide deacetylase